MAYAKSFTNNSNISMKREIGIVIISIAEFAVTAGSLFNGFQEIEINHISAKPL